jgi:hypothetical protein
MAYAVLVPERFRGCCPFGVIVVEAMNSPAGHVGALNRTGCSRIALEPADVVVARKGKSAFPRSFSAQRRAIPTLAAIPRLGFS